MSFLLISADLHNTLCVVSSFLMIFLFSFWITKRIREVYLHYTVVADRSRNVLYLTDCTMLSELREVLHTIHDNIDMNPRQLRRLLKTALDENVVKKVSSTSPNLHISPHFTVSLPLLKIPRPTPSFTNIYRKHPRGTHLHGNNVYPPI